MIETIKIVAIVAAAVFVIFQILRLMLKRTLFKASYTLPSESWILTNKTLKPVLFNDAGSANAFAQVSKKGEIYWDIYAIYNGKIVKCGSTSENIIIQ